MSYRGARVGGAVAQSASRFGEILMQLMAQKKQDERYNAETAYRTSRDKITDDNNATLRNIAANQAQAELDMSGYLPGRFVESQNFEPVSASVKAPDMGLGLARGMGSKGIGQQLMELTAPSGSLRPQTTQTFAPASYDPSRDVELQRDLAIEKAKAKPPEAPYDPATDPVVVRQRYMQNNGLARNPNLPAPRQPKDPDEPTAGIPGISKLPAEAQSAATQYAPMYKTLQDYEDMSRKYLERSRLDRGAGKLGFADKDRDAALGELKATQQVLIGQAKNVLKLGVLAGPDMQLVMDLIGDPTSGESLARDPEYTLARFKRAREMIKSGVKTFRDTYGVDIPLPPDPEDVQTPPPGSGRTSGAGPGRTAGGAPPVADVWTRIQNDPNLTPEQKADLLRRRPR